MAALSKFFDSAVGILLTSHANSFFSLSPVAGDQVRVNHVIWFEESMSKQKNKSNLQINQTLLIAL